MKLAATTEDDLPSSSTIFTLIFQFTGKRKQNPVFDGVAGPVLSKKLCSFDRRGVEWQPQLATGSWKMEGELKVDKFGYEVRTSSDACVSAINAFCDQCVLANFLAAYFLSSDPSRAPSHLQAAKSRLLLKSFPRDLASLQRAQVLCFFYIARPDLSLDLGQQMCHVLQYNRCFKEAVEFMEECSPSWDLCSSFMFTHNWWLVALCYLEGHAPIQRIRDLYDHSIWKELEKPDASRPEANWYLDWQFDMLVLWALAYTGEISRAEELLKGLKSRITKMNEKKQQFMQNAILLAEATYESGKGNEKQALELLGPDFDADNYKMIGASGEQIDIFNELWYSMLLNNGQAAKVGPISFRRVSCNGICLACWREDIN